MFELADRKVANVASDLNGRFPHLNLDPSTPEGSAEVLEEAMKTEFGQELIKDEVADLQDDLRDWLKDPNIPTKDPPPAGKSSLRIIAGLDAESTTYGG